MIAFSRLMGYQVHKLDDGTVRVFSRNSEDMSKKYPDLVQQLPQVCMLPVSFRAFYGCV
jgi:hypothetical protein